MPKHEALYSKKLVSEQELKQRIDALAAELIQKFSGQDPLFVCLMRGGVPFASQLMFAITEQDPEFRPELDYMTVSRYGSERTPSTAPRVIMDLSHKTAIAGRPVIVLDDIIDKGETYAYSRKHLENKGAGKVYLAALVQREIEEPREFDADFFCFSISSPEWLMGMGLDDAQLGKEANRWAKYIAIASHETE